MPCGSYILLSFDFDIDFSRSWYRKISSPKLWSFNYSRRLHVRPKEGLFHEKRISFL